MTQPGPWDHDPVLDPPHEPSPGQATDGSWVFTRLDEFVPLLVEVWCVRVNDTSGRHWCAQWWKHQNVEFLFKTLWRSWEALHAEPTGNAQWFVHYVIPIMNFVCAPDGPFANCTKDQHADDPITPMPLIDPPPGFF